MKITIEAPESIEVDLAGRVFVIKEITQEMMNKVTEAGTEGDLAQQAAVVLGVDADELTGIDVRILAGFFKAITNHITSFAGDDPPPSPVAES